MNKSPTPIRIPDEIKAALKKQAESEGRTLSNLIIQILKTYLENETLRKKKGMGKN